MGFGDLWNRTLAYFGIAEEYDEAWDDDGYATEEELEQSYAERPSANVRRLTPRGGSRDEYDDWTVSESNALPEPGSSAETLVHQPSREPAPARPRGSARSRPSFPRTTPEARSTRTPSSRRIDRAGRRAASGA